jgi:DNA polymerase-1
VEEKWGVPPERIIDLLGLMGDSSDNVPGVQGVGKITAVKLLQEYGSFENILKHAGEVKNKRVREGLTQGVDDAHLSRELVTIKTDLDLPIEVEEMELERFDFETMDQLFQELEFFRLQSQLDAFRGEENIKIVEEVEKDFVTVESSKELKTLVKTLKSAELISFDVESTSTDPMFAKIVGFSFAVKPDTDYLGKHGIGAGGFHIKGNQLGTFKCFDQSFKFLRTFHCDKIFLNFFHYLDILFTPESIQLTLKSEKL